MNSIDRFSFYQLRERTIVKQKVFKQALDQIKLINIRMEDIQVRCLRAKAQGKLAFVHSHQTVIRIMEGARNFLYDHCHNLCDELAKLNEEMRELCERDESESSGSSTETSEDEGSVVEERLI